MLLPLDYGNRIWTKEKYSSQIRDGFKDLAEFAFYSDFQVLSADDPDPVGQVNGWVANVTRGRITELLGT